MEYGLPISKDGPSKKKGWSRKLATSTLTIFFVPALSNENFYQQGTRYVSWNVLRTLASSRSGKGGQSYDFWPFRNVMTPNRMCSVGECWQFCQDGDFFASDGKQTNKNPPILWFKDDMNGLGMWLSQCLLRTMSELQCRQAPMTSKPATCIWGAMKIFTRRCRQTGSENTPEIIQSSEASGLCIGSHRCLRENAVTACLTESKVHKIPEWDWELKNWR